MKLMMLIIKHFILLSLILSIQYGVANGTSRSPLPPYKDVVGSSAPVADGVPPPPPPYCVYPPPAKPTLPAPLPPTPASPGAAPPASTPSTTPGSPPTTSGPGATPPAGTLPSIAPGTPPPAGAAPAPPSTAPPGSPPTATNEPPPPPSPVVFPGPGTTTHPGVWCVANPTVASAVAQTAMDYACGSGADCDMLAPGAPCFLPDTLMAHASYAFNSYWQRTKVAGGTCDFAGAAMLITKDPSYDGCRYMYM
ncbi:vegetative cell wall protein gp1-like [Oryza brachyantha]|uniref:vegetative cell wall protein gp1-like n=1 Tax=Oryza brachyantha TaxID=4533 RepID=UPI001ADD14B9|nr:vegetative cell wall protein gp1-like [Oryza brachyantha]